MQLHVADQRGIMLFARCFRHDPATVVAQGEASGAGRALVYKLSSDSRKNNTASFVVSQNASTILGSDVNNFVGERLYNRTDVDGLAPYPVIQVPTSSRESSSYEPDLLH